MSLAQIAILDSLSFLTKETLCCLFFPLRNDAGLLFPVSNIWLYLCASISHPAEKSCPFLSGGWPAETIGINIASGLLKYFSIFLGNR